MSGSGLLYGALTVLAVSAIFVATKPRIAYDENGKSLCFGIDQDQTLLPVWLAAAAGGVAVYALHVAM
jgi:hypothetical protein